MGVIWLLGTIHPVRTAVDGRQLLPVEAIRLFSIAGSAPR